MNRAARLLSLLLLAGYLTGCASAPPETAVIAPQDAGPGWTQNVEESAALFLATDDGVKGKVDIDGMTSFTRKEGGLKVACRLRNQTGQPLAVQLHALFRRADGSTLEEMPWRTVVLPVGKAVPFVALNEDPAAARVLVELRLNRGG